MGCGCSNCSCSSCQADRSGAAAGVLAVVLFVIVTAGIMLVGYGIYKIWTHPRWTWKGKLALTCAIFALPVMALVPMILIQATEPQMRAKAEDHRRAQIHAQQQAQDRQEEKAAAEAEKQRRSAELRLSAAPLPVRVDAVAGIRFVKLPSPADQSECWMARTEVTQKQWRKVMGSTQAQCSARVGRKTIFEGDLAPIHDITWEEAQGFCRRLTEMSRDLPEGMAYRLPSELEWQPAALAGRSEVDLSQAWLATDRLHQVAKHQPNPWGLYDMSGNVAEWCIEVPGAGDLRVLRGGGWSDSLDNGRSESRASVPASTRSQAIGFRIVLAGLRR